MKFALPNVGGSVVCIKCMDRNFSTSDTRNRILWNKSQEPRLSTLQFITINILNLFIVT